LLIDRACVVITIVLAVLAYSRWRRQHLAERGPAGGLGADTGASKVIRAGPLIDRPYVVITFIVLAVLAYSPA
jgi:hypothetical protein